MTQKVITVLEARPYVTTVHNIKVLEESPLKEALVREVREAFEVPKNHVIQLIVKRTWTRKPKEALTVEKKQKKTRKPKGSGKPEPEK